MRTMLFSWPLCVAAVLLTGCSGGGPTTPTPQKVAPVINVSASVVSMIAGRDSILGATVVPGVWDSIRSVPAGLPLQFVSGGIKVSPAGSQADTFAVTVWATNDGITRSAGFTVNVERQKTPSITVGNADVFLNGNTLLPVTVNGDTDRCTARLGGPSTSTYGPSPIVGDSVVVSGKCNVTYLPGSAALRGGILQRTLEVCAHTDQPGRPAPCATSVVTRRKPRALLTRVEGSVCRSGVSTLRLVSATRTHITWNGATGDDPGTVSLVHHPSQTMAPPTWGIRGTYESDSVIIIGVQGTIPDHFATDHMLVTVTNGVADGWQDTIRVPVVECPAASLNAEVPENPSNQQVLQIESGWVWIRHTGLYMGPVN